MHKFKGFNSDAKEVLTNILNQLAISHIDPKTMVYYACAQLHQQRIEIPNFDTFARIITDVINQQEHHLEQIITDHITHSQQQLLDRLIRTSSNHAVSTLTLWKHIDHSENPKAIQSSVQRFIEIKKTFKRLESLIDALNLTDPVRMVEIPKSSGGTRKLGIPTVRDRIAQMVGKLYLEPELEAIFQEDSYGYRPNRSALTAVGKARERCFKQRWVIDLDIKGFFDHIDHDLLLKKVINF